MFQLFKVKFCVLIPSNFVKILDNLDRSQKRATTYTSLTLIIDLNVQRFIAETYRKFLRN